MKKELLSTEREVLTHLKYRLKLSPKNKRRLEQLNRGHIGEQKFRKIIKQTLHNEHLLLYNLLLETDGSLFQIDFLIISNDTIYLYEIKNYSGDYYICDNRWYTVRSKKEIRNPLRQLERSTYLLQQLLQKHPTQFKVKSFIIFINKEFMLYEAPVHPQLIFPSQISRHMECLNGKMSATITSKRQKEINQWLKHQHTERNFTDIPKYNLQKLNKGIFCRYCSRKMMKYSRSFVTCRTCRVKENIDIATLRSIEQLTILFPEKRIRTNLIHEWCGEMLPRRAILRILKKYFKLINNGRNSYFVKSPTK